MRENPRTWELTQRLVRAEERGVDGSLEGFTHSQVGVGARGRRQACGVLGGQCWCWWKGVYFYLRKWSLLKFILPLKMSVFLFVCMLVF